MMRVLAAGRADSQAGRRSCGAPLVQTSVPLAVADQTLPRDTTIINQLNLGAINPALSGVVYNFPVRATGNQGLTEESTESIEVGYTGIIAKRATVSAAVYWTTNEDEIFFTQTGRYLPPSPPPGWPLPPGVLAALPPPCVTLPCTTGGLPSAFSYLNLGTVKNKGFELGVDGALSEAVNVFANYSYQTSPCRLRVVGDHLPPTNRFNVGSLQPWDVPRQCVGQLC